MYKFHEVQLISISCLMMAYGLGRNIALLQTSLYLFNHLPPPTSKRIKQKTTRYFIMIYYYKMRFKLFI